MMSSQDSRTVSLRRARAAQIFSAACVLICAAAFLFFLVLAVGFSASPFLLIAPAVGAFFSVLRFRLWSRSIAWATSGASDEMRWTP